MPLVLAWIASFAIAWGPLLVRGLTVLGVGFVVLTGVTAGLGELKTAMWSNLGATSSSILTILTIAKVDEGIAIILSAVTTGLAWKGVNMVSGSLRRFGSVGGA